MNAGDAQIYFEPKRERNVRWFFWWSDAAGPQPELSVARLCCSAAILHKGEEACFLVGWDLVLGEVADDSGTVPLMCHLAHIFTFLSHVGLSCGNCLLNVSFQVLPSFGTKSLSQVLFLMRLPLPFLFLCFLLLPTFPFSLFHAAACLFSLTAAVLVGFSIFLKAAGKFKLNTPLSTCSSKSSNLRMLSLTCVHEKLACLHKLNHL